MRPVPLLAIMMTSTTAVEAQTAQFDAVAAAPKSHRVRGEPEGLHAVTNRGTKPFVAVRIEFKDQAPVKSDTSKP
jgi:hypothetical protein